MHDPDAKPVSADSDVPFRSDRVESPQQYSTWRDYAFSEEPETEGRSRP
jgi:hypothetical protein